MLDVPDAHDLLINPQRKIEQVLQDMIDTEHDADGTQGWRRLGVAAN